MERRLGFLAVLVSLSSVGAAAFAVPGTASSPLVWAKLEYTRLPGSEACPNEQELRNLVASRVGHDPFGPEGTTLVRVSLSRVGSIYIAAVEQRDAVGNLIWSRPPLADPSCVRVAELVEISVVSAILPVGPDAPLPIAPVTLPPPVVVTAPYDPPPRIEPSPTPPRVRGPDVRLGVRGGIAVATAPEPVPSVALDVSLRWRAFSLTLEGRADAQTTTGVQPEVQLRTSLLAASIVPCGHYSVFVGCGLLSLGGIAMRSSGQQLTGADGSGLFVGVGARAGVEWAVLDHVALRASADALADVGPVVARVSTQEVWRTPAFSAVVGGGVLTTF